jgi:uncharacterized protein with HEPN domain
VIGEAANRLYPAVRDQPGFPWGKIIAFRNRGVMIGDII